MTKWTNLTSGEATFVSLPKFTFEESRKRAQEDFWGDSYKTSKQEFIINILVPMFAGKKKVEKLEKRIERLEEEIMKFKGGN